MNLADALAWHPSGTLLDVWVVAGASRSELRGTHDGALRVRIATAPRRGEANAAVAGFLASVLGVGRVELVSGSTSRRKRFLAHGIGPGAAAARLSEIGS